MWGLGIFFSDAALPDSEIPNLQLGILSPTGYLISPIGDNMPDWGYFLLVVYLVSVVRALIEVLVLTVVAIMTCKDSSVDFNLNVIISFS